MLLWVVELFCYLLRLAEGFAVVMQVVITCESSRCGRAFCGPGSHGVRNLAVHIHCDCSRKSHSHWENLCVAVLLVRCSVQRGGRAIASWRSDIGVATTAGGVNLVSITELILFALVRYSSEQVNGTSFLRWDP
jgi:hypothetical protein